MSSGHEDEPTTAIEYYDGQQFLCPDCRGYMEYDVPADTPTPKG
jgi:hypothetical protein